MNQKAAKQFRKMYRDQVQAVVEGKAAAIFRRKLLVYKNLATIGWVYAILFAVLAGVLLARMAR